MRVYELLKKLQEAEEQGFGLAETYIVKVELFPSENRARWNDEVVLSTKEDL